jgi:hypothetical protein
MNLRILESPFFMIGFAITSFSIGISIGWHGIEFRWKKGPRMMVEVDK